MSDVYMYVTTLTLLNNYESYERIVGVYSTIAAAISTCESLLDDHVEWEDTDTLMIGRANNLMTEWSQGWADRVVFVIRRFPCDVTPRRPQYTNDEFDYGDDDIAHF